MESEIVEEDSTLELETISKRAVKGAFTLTTRKFLLQIVSYLGSIFLARLLTPEIFGIFAIVSFVIAFFSFFSNAGLGAALIQKKEKLTKKDLAVAFTTQQALTFILILLVFALSPVINSYYHLSEDKIWLIRVFSLSLFLTSLKTIPLILLERKLKFNKAIIPEIVEVVSFQILVVLLAFFNFGVWSFVIALLVRSVLGVFVLYLVSPWKPCFGWDLEKTKKLLSFGIPYQANGFIAMIKDAVMPVFVASVAGAGAVGYLNWANTYSKIPIILMGDIFRITFPSFARIQGRKKLLKKALEKILKYTNFFLFPSVFILMASIKQITHFIFTDKWNPALTAFYIHSIGILVVGIANTFMNTFWSLGRVKIATKLMIVYTIVNWGTSVPLVYKFGFNGAMIGSVIVLYLSLPLNTYFLRKIVKVEIIKNIWASFLAGLLAGIATYILAQVLITDIFSLLLVLFSGGLIYLAFLFIFEGKELISEARWILKKMGAG